MKYNDDHLFPEYNQQIWSIPPPFDTKSGLSSTSPLKMPSLVTKRDFTTERIFRKQSLQTLPRVVVRARVVQPIDSKHPAWLPATKHDHTYQGCAPNGLRLFPEPSGTLLSKHMKKLRDQTLQSTLQKARRELRDFEMQRSEHLGSLAAAADRHGSLGRYDPESRMCYFCRCCFLFVSWSVSCCCLFVCFLIGPYGLFSILTLACFHWCVSCSVMDIRNIEQYASKRCNSRWRPALGRARPREDEMSWKPESPQEN